MHIANSALDLVGHTPIVRASRWSRGMNLSTDLLVKIEQMNPTGSVKDRIALAMIEDAQARGMLKPGSVIIEPTSGNTGIGLASVAAVKGLRAIIVMPETMSVERRKLIAAYGAEIVLTPGSQGMAGAVAKATELAASIPGSFIPSQFDNPANPQAHFLATGPEIWNDTEGGIDAFVAGFGTGGTVSGVGRYLKSRNPDVRIIAVEPAGSPLISQGRAGPHKIQGIGANFVPATLDRRCIDEIVTVTDEDAINAATEFPRREGILIGISAGAALHAATAIASRPGMRGRTVVALLPDSGDRYLSTPAFDL